MNRSMVALVLGLSAIVALIVACGPSAPASAPAVSPTLAAAPTVPAATETSPAVPTVPVIVAPTATPTQAATAAPTAVATPAAPGTLSAGAACRNNSTFVGDVTVPDGTQLAAGEQFNKTWRLRNSGTCAWTSGYELAFVRATNLAANPGAVPATAPGATADVRLPMTTPTAPGSYIGFYRMRTPNGTAFGDTVWVSIRVGGTPVPAPTVVPNFTLTPSAPTPPGAACTNNSAFVADATFPDGTQVGAGQPFVKTWRIRNTGTCAWDGGYTLAFERGTALTANTSVGLPSAAPGATVDVSVTLSAQAPAGTYTSVWRPKAPGGTFFGQAFWAIIRVGSGPTAAPSPTP